MAGTNPDFNASEFRSVIKATMQMGIPTNPDEQLVWHIKPIRAYAPQDPALRPYNWSAPPDLDVPGDPEHPSGMVVVDYALEFSATASGGDTEAGRFDTSRLVVTLLDVDYEEIRSADYAMIGRVHYDITFVGPPMGMFDCSVYQVYLQARDQA